MNIHRRTPTVSVSDGRGLSVRQVAYLRSVAGQAATVLITRQTHNASGRLVAQRDPRLPAPNLTTDYDLSGNPLKADSVDAGWHLSLPGLAGQVLQRWNARGQHWRTRYDLRLRILEVEENAVPAVEVYSYGAATADAGQNLRGQLLTLKDAAGGLSLHSYSLHGEVLHETRTFIDNKAFASQRRFSPLGAIIEQVDAGGHRQQSAYDVAGQLRSLRLQLKGQSSWQAVLLDAHYNAATQISEQHHGNGVISHWTYDQASGRLQRQHAGKPSAALLQDLEYVYDPMGNITRILDHAFTPSHFANQRVDGHRSFSYDSLYRLIQATGHDDAPPSDNPGLPQPTDPADRRNYTQTYGYDAGGNLIHLVHVRDGASHTRQMRIDPSSNRGVRWADGDPVPDFEKLLDAHGNLLALQPGQDLQWNPLDQLASVTLVKRENGQNDAEHYRYSQGVRIHKRLETVTGHFHDVRYLPGLEIRTKDNGEELHAITLAAGSGSVRCLHWIAGKPAGIDADQLRYSLQDNLGSSVMELDQQAQMISHEGYYPFGATAWMAARSAIEVSYKTIRHSGREMDVSGLYYYGARYFAPWLQRWISADPAGSVDGLNLYGFVGNNPLRYVDPSGGAKAEAMILFYSGFISALNEHAGRTLVQIDNIIYKKNISRNLLLNLAGETVGGVLGYEAGVIGSGQAQQVLPQSAFSPPYLDRNALIGGNIGGDVVGAVAAPLVGMMTGALIPQTSTMSVAAIDKQLGVTAPLGKTPVNWREIKDEVIHPALNTVLNPEFVMNRVMSSWLSIIPGTINMFQRAIEGEDIKNRLDPVKISKIDTMLVEWKAAVENRWASAEQAFDALGRDTVYPADLLPNVNHMTSPETLAPVRRSELQQQTGTALEYIARLQSGMRYYKEIGTTDNQWILNNPGKAKARGFKPSVMTRG